MRETVQECRARDLWEDATQAVMGEGARHASLMMVGEQPGDREDIEGHPFVGPAGLGATSGKALRGSQIRIGRDRGTQIDSDLAELVTLTAHPSSILRERDDAAREEAMGQFVSDLSHVAKWLSVR
jgi:uracil-DNA glycosylase